MQESVKRILEGNFDYENGSLDFSCTKLELSLPRGSVYEGSFHITATSNSYTNGYITTSDIRMECLLTEFTGNDVEVPFCFHGEYMEEGDVLKGTFSIVSNQGEYYLPFVVSIEHTVLDSSVGNVKNLFHFANLAKTNWREAVNLFYSGDFPRVFAGSDAQLYDCYRALSAFPGNEQNMEEFLIQNNKKQKVSFLVEEDSLQMELPVMASPYSVTEAELSIVRNGWGYTALQVECDGDFLFTEKEYLTDDDFLGNRCRLPVYVDSSLCRRGKNFGKVYLYNSYVSLEVPVTVRLGEADAGKYATLSRKRIIVQLMEFYQAFRLKKINKSTWLKETGKLVVRLVALDESDVASRLFQAQLLITEERFNEAGWLLQHAAELMEGEQMEDSALWAYYLYLTTLINREEEYVDWAAEEVELIYKRNSREWRVAWLLLYLSEEYNKSASAKWVFLEKQFHYGCTSPVLYIEALQLLNSNPSVLRKAEGFGLQVIYFGAKQELLSAEVVEQLLYLTGKVREYSSVLEQTLELLYSRKQDVRILQELCTLLIKGGKVGLAYFTWYEKGVEAQLRITNLYEYYMMSLDMQKIQELPKIVLMYFMYQNNLDYERTAFLYYYILQHKEEYSELYDSYRPRIERFVIDQIQKGRINRYLAGLYQEVLTPGIVTEQTAPSLARLLFAHQVTVEDARLRKIIVYQPGNLQPAVYHIQDRRAWIVLYGNDNIIVFEDAYGNRFMKTVDYTLEKLLMSGKYIRILAHYVKDSHGLDVYLCEEDRYEGDISPDSVERYKRLIASTHCAMSVKSRAYMNLLQYYYSADDAQGMEEYLKRLPMEELSAEERAQVVRFMVMSGKNQMAYECFTTYGSYFADVKILLRFVDEMVPQMDYQEDAVLLAAASHVFKKGKYSGILLLYLARHFKGMTKDMRDIWKMTASYEDARYELSERMLVQMLYSGAFIGEKMEIFRYYVSMGAKQEIEAAVLAQCAYEFFVKEKLTEAFVFQEIYRVYSRGDEVQGISKLAFLKYYAENQEEMPAEAKYVAQGFLKEMLDKKIYLNCFREYKEFSHIWEEMRDRTVIEYRSISGGRPRIHYVMLHDNGDADEYVSRYMQEVYPGVYSVDFVLFFGECLQYYIMEENEDGEQLTESGSIQKSDSVGGQPGSKFEMINDMAISKSMQDYDTLDHLLEEYCGREYLNEQLFVLK